MVEVSKRCFSQIFSTMKQSIQGSNTALSLQGPWLPLWCHTHNQGEQSELYQNKAWLKGVYGILGGVFQSISCVCLFVTSQTVAHQASLSFIISWSLLKLMSIELVMPSNHLILCCPLLLLPSIFPIIRVFSNELLLCIRWPKYQSFSISLSNEYLGLISFRTDSFDLLAVQGTLKSLFEHHSSKASIIQPSAFFMVQLSHPYMTTRKTIALTLQIFVGQSNVSAF